MATFTSLGVGSGLDLNSLVTKLVALERSPLAQMQRDAGKLQTQVSSFGKMKSLFSALQDSSNALNNNPLWASSSAKSSDETAVTAIGGTGAVAGSYAVTVQSLAASQTLASNTVFGSATDLVGAGSLTLTLGSWNADQTSFADKSGATPVTLSISATDTVQSLRDKINGANAGVTATLVTDANGTRLSLRSSDTGVANGFKITASDADGNDTDAAGLSRLAFDPPGGADGMAIKQSATNARATVNGIAVESASNELSGVVDGVSLRLKRETSDPINVTVSRDTDAVLAAVKSFADAYNALAGYIGDQTKYDATSKVGGALQGDSAVGTLQSQLRAVLATVSGASAAFPRLSDLGLQLTRTGTLTIDQAKLGKAINDNLAEVKKAFSNSDTGTPANDGFARRYAQLATRVLGIDGSLSTRTDGLKKLISKNTDNQARVNDRADRFQSRLVLQYTAMDSNLSKLNALSNYVTAQLAALTGSNTRR